MGGATQIRRPASPYLSCWTPNLLRAPERRSRLRRSCRIITFRMHLLERQKQLEELNRCFNEARAGSGKLVLIGAEAGVGKSALVERFVAERRREARALWGACDGLSTPPPLAPVHEIAAQTRLQHGRAAREEESRERLFRMLLDDFAQPEPCV